MARPASPAATSMPERPDVFVSYSRRDKDFGVGDTLFPALVARGKDVWIDLEDILAGGMGLPRQQVLGRARGRGQRGAVRDQARTPGRQRVCSEELARARRAATSGLIPVVRREPGDGRGTARVARAPTGSGCASRTTPSVALAPCFEGARHRPRGGAMPTCSPRSSAPNEWLRPRRRPAAPRAAGDLRAAECVAPRSSSEARGASDCRPGRATSLPSRQATTPSPAAPRSAAVATALGVAVALAVFALIQRSQARSTASTSPARASWRRARSSALPRDPELVRPARKSRGVNEKRYGSEAE